MKRAVVMLLCLGVMGCGPQAKPTDLERFIVQTYAAADVVATPLPPAPSYQPLPFSPSVGSDPFVSAEHQRRCAVDERKLLAARGVAAKRCVRRL